MTSKAVLGILTSQKKNYRRDRLVYDTSDFVFHISLLTRYNFPPLGLGKEISQNYTFIFHGPLGTEEVGPVVAVQEGGRRSCFSMASRVREGYPSFLKFHFEGWSKRLECKSLFRQTNRRSFKPLRLKQSLNLISKTKSKADFYYDEGR